MNDPTCFGGVDWAATPTPSAPSMPRGGRLRSSTSTTPPRGLSELCRRLNKAGVALAAIERPDGPIVDAALADLGGAQGRLRVLDNDYYVRGALTNGRYRSVRGKLERKNRPPARVSRRRHQAADGPAPRSSRFWAEADFAQRRERLALVVERVTATPGYGPLRPSRVRVALTGWARVAEHRRDHVSRGRHSTRHRRCL